MRIKCPQCSTLYNIELSAINEDGTKIECSRCFTVFIAKKKKSSRIENVISNIKGNISEWEDKSKQLVSDKPKEKKKYRKKKVPVRQEEHEEMEFPVDAFLTEEETSQILNGFKEDIAEIERENKAYDSEEFEVKAPEPDKTDNADESESNVFKEEGKELNLDEIIDDFLETDSIKIDETTLLNAVVEEELKEELFEEAKEDHHKEVKAELPVPEPPLEKVTKAPEEESPPPAAEEPKVIEEPSAEKQEEPSSEAKAEVEVKEVKEESKTEPAAEVSKEVPLAEEKAELSVEEAKAEPAPEPAPEPPLEKVTKAPEEESPPPAAEEPKVIEEPSAEKQEEPSSEAKAEVEVKEVKEESKTEPAAEVSKEAPLEEVKEEPPTEGVKTDSKEESVQGAVDGELKKESIEKPVEEPTEETDEASNTLDQGMLDALLADAAKETTASEKTVTETSDADETVADKKKESQSEDVIKNEVVDALLTEKPVAIDDDKEVQKKVEDAEEDETLSEEELENAVDKELDEMAEKRKGRLDEYEEGEDEEDEEDDTTPKKSNKIVKILYFLLGITFIKYILSINKKVLGVPVKLVIFVFLFVVISFGAVSSIFIWQANKAKQSLVDSGLIAANKPEDSEVLSKPSDDLASETVEEKADNIVADEDTDLFVNGELNEESSLEVKEVFEKEENLVKLGIIMPVEYNPDETRIMSMMVKMEFDNAKIVSDINSSAAYYEEVIESAVSKVLVDVFYEDIKSAEDMILESVEKRINITIKKGKIKNLAFENFMIK